MSHSEPATVIVHEVDVEALPITGTCDLTTTGRRTGQPRKIEIWYVVVDGAFTITGTPGSRGWLANLREHAEATLELHDPPRQLHVVAAEIVDEDERRRVAGEVRRLQPWYGSQPYTVDDWVAGAPMITLEIAGGR